MRDVEIKKRLNGVIDRLVLPAAHIRCARYTIDRLVPEVQKLLREELREYKSKQNKGDT